jgi:pimeloyl-ACP methyl ester carboxylesterase
VKIIRIICSFVFIIAIAGAVYQYFGTKSDEQAYQPVGKMVDVGGYKLHMIDSNIGSATVVIDSGAGEKTLDWCLVQPEIATFARVITYDRAGYAWSDVSSLHRTSESIVKELHTMLHNAKIPAPYVLVGHAFGGINVRLFASTYPDEVAGVILIDAAHENMFEKIPQLRPNVFMLYAVLVANHVGVFRLLNLFSLTQHKLHDVIAKYPAYLQRIYPSLISTTKYINAMTQEALLIEDSCKQLKAAGGLLGNKPLTVISSGQQLIYEQIAGYMIPNQDANCDISWSQLQADLVTKSSQGKQIITRNNGHIISLDQPKIIIDAVREMVNALKEGK